MALLDTDFDLDLDFEEDFGLDFDEDFDLDTDSDWTEKSSERSSNKSAKEDAAFFVEVVVGFVLSRWSFTTFRSREPLSHVQFPSGAKQAGLALLFNICKVATDSSEISHEPFYISILRFRLV